MPDIADATAAAEETLPPKRSGPKGGRPRKDGAPVGSRSVTAKGEIVAPFVPDPPFKNFYSDHDNQAQKTRSCWRWWDALSTPFKNQIDAHVYRDWPVLLDPPEDWCPDCKLIMSAELDNCPRCGKKLEAQDFKYIDKLVGVEPVNNDQEFIDKYGAGDYRLYLNANPPDGKRRTLATCFIKGTHDFRTYPPADRRIQDVANLSLTDPLNTAYVAWLRSQGKIPDEEKQKEREDMAASGVLVEKLIDRVDKLTDRAIEKAERTDTQAAPAETPRTPEEHLNDALGLVERLSKLTARPESNGQSDLATLMQIMDRLRAASDPAPYLTLIREQGEKIREIELRHLNEKIDLLKADLLRPPQTTVTTTDGANIQSVIEKAVEKAVEKAGIGEEADTSWWVDPLKQLIPVAMPVVFAGLQQWLAPRPNPPTQPIASPGFPGAPQTQPQLNAPAPQPQAQPQPIPSPQATGVYTTGNPRLDMLLMLIQVPLADFLRDGDSGSLFAQDYFIETHGRDLHAEVAKLGTEGITAILYNYPPLVPILKPMARADVVKFVDQFVTYNPDNPVTETEKGGAA